ncbi:hypothetical protein FXO37_03179 [Capsicum annuum]|nr:hypothetical protein FXO37_03179 [Capsicum annuum]
MTALSDIFDKYADSTKEYNLANQELTIVEYINGYRLHASVPWHTVDYIFVPVNFGRIHWVLVFLSFNDRCLYVYDSLRYARHDASIALEVKKLSQLLPSYLSISDFYKKKGDYGVFIIAYAEYLSHGKGIPHGYFDAKAFRTCYAALLWQHGTQKNKIGAVSDDESPYWPVRPQFDVQSFF